MTDSEVLLKWHCRPPVALPLRYARRLVRMGPREVVARLRASGNGRLVAPAWQPPDPCALAESLERRFLFGPLRGRQIVDSWSRLHPEQAERFLDAARRGLEQWEIFGVPVSLQPGKLDWQRGDTRWVWELNRHQFLFTFARAWVLTGEPAYAERIAMLLEDWRANNRHGEGVNWSSALEVGLRALSWLWSLPLMLGWKGLGDSFFRRWLASLHEHYQYLKGHLSVYTDPTNHLIGEAAALWTLSVALPELPEAARQEHRALGILARELERQVTPDGVTREQSTGYQRFVLDFCRQVIAIARRTGRNLPPAIAERRAAMSDFLAALTGRGENKSRKFAGFSVQQNQRVARSKFATSAFCHGLLGGAAGELPSIGDSDDARGVPFTEPEPDIAAWLDEPAIPARPAGPGSRIFRQGGYCLWQAGAAGRRMAMLFDCGPLGLWPNASHGHADALSIQVQLGGRWLLGDPGTGSYAGCRRVRDLLRGTAAHNTVTVDGLDQTDAIDVFKWLQPVPTRLLEAGSAEQYDYAVAVHEGYHRLREPVTHYRAVFFVRPPAPQPGWIVVDRLEGCGRHHCALRFHFPPGAEVHYEYLDGVLVMDPSEETGLRLGFVALGPVREAVEPMCQPGLWSRRFGQWETARVLTLERSTELPLAWFTFLTPAGQQPRPEASRAERRGGSILCARGEETVVWTIEGSRHRFSYRRAGPQSGSFER